jgi:hypothetical protein
MKTISVFLLAFFIAINDFGATLPSTYIHLNKSTYLAGESIWFSVYLTDAESKKLWQNTEVVYIQLFDKTGKLIEKSAIQSQNGRGWGKVKTPDFLESGIYRLRAFTSHGIQESLITEKWIDILHPQAPAKFNAKFEGKTVENEELFGINVRTDKSDFKKREKVKVHILTKDPSTLSVSVIDLKNMPLDSSQNILYRYKPSQAQVQKVQTHQGGFRLSGLVKETPSMNILKDYDLLLVLKDEVHSKTLLTKTDDKGRFLIENVQIFGEATITYQGINKKGVAFPIKIEFEALEPQVELGAIDYKREAKEYDYKSLASYKLNDGEKINSTINLGEITVKGIKSEPTDPIPSKLYDKPTLMFINDGKNRGFPNVFDMIAGQLGSVRITYTSNGGLMIPIVQVCPLCPEPLYVLDGAALDPSNGKAILMSLNPNDIYRVDLLNYVDASIYGTRAMGGVILFYTKRYANMEQNYKSNIHKIKGYDYKSDFNSPDYSKVTEKVQFDNRQSIYWNPEVVTDEKGYVSVEFYAADLPTNYAIVVEGINENGKVGRGVKRVSVR